MNLTGKQINADQNYTEKCFIWINLKIFFLFSLVMESTICQQPFLEKLIIIVLSFEEQHNYIFTNLSFVCSCCKLHVTWPFKICQACVKCIQRLSRVLYSGPQIAPRQAEINSMQCNGFSYMRPCKHPHRP